jgi:hypothetical protein
MCQHACKVDSSPSLDELSERVCSDPIEKDSRYCAAHQPEDFRIVKKAAIPTPCDEDVDRGMALAQWQAQIRRLRLLVERADEFTPSVFVKKVDESLRELRKAAMRTVIHSGSSDEK